MLADCLKHWFPNTAGILISMAGYFLFSLQDATVKWLVADHPVPQILFMRSVTIVAICLVLGRGSLIRQCAASHNKLPLLLRAPSFSLPGSAITRRPASCSSPSWLRSISQRR
jgi:hypothetical protein